MIDRTKLSRLARSLASEGWATAVDTAGSHILADVPSRRHSS
jgi:hypothetical protein